MPVYYPSSIPGVFEGQSDHAQGDDAAQRESRDQQEEQRTQI